MSNSRRDDKREEVTGRNETSLLYSSGSWRPPGASLLPTPLNLLGGGRPGSAARPSWSKAGGGSGQPPKVTPLVMANAGRAIEEGNLFRPVEVLENAFVNSATVEERAVDSELQRQSLLFSDAPRASRPGLTAMLNYMTNNNALPGAGTGVGGSGGISGGGTRSADYATVLAAAGMGGGSPYGVYTGFDAIQEEVSGASLEYAADSTLRPGQLSPSTSPVPGAAPSRASPALAGGRTAATAMGAAGGAGGSDAWFGPSSGTIGQGAGRPVSSRPGAGRPISAKPPTGGSRPVSAVGNGAAGAAGAGVVTLSAQERRTIEGKLIASMGLAGTGRVRGESPQGQWAQTRTSKSNAGTAAPGATGGAARPVSAPRAYANMGGASRPVSATMAVAAAAAASKRRASATQAAGGGAAAVASLRPMSALPGGGMGAAAGGSRPVSGVPYGAGARGPMTVTVTPGEEVTLQPYAAPQMLTSPAARPLSPNRPTTARSPSPTRAVPSWMLTRPGSPPPDEYGGTARPMSALSTATASVAAVAAPLLETAGVPPAPYRQRNEFQQSGKKIPTGCRPLSAFSTLSSATPRTSLSLAPSLAGGVAAGAGPVVPLSESIADQPVYNEEDGPIKMSYEVVDYFSTHGQNAHKKLFYLNERRPSNMMEVVSPFDLVVVPAERVDRAQYWTMSALGVVHVEAGRPDEGQFTPLGEWIRLSSVYGLLRKMRFFKHFLLTRSFRRWRANVKRSAFERTRELLGRLLFGAVPTFQSVMLRAGQLVQAMRETAVVSITTRIDRLYSLEEFVAEQDHRRSQVAAPALAKLVDELCAELLAVGSRIDMERERMEKLVDIPTLRANEFVTFIPGPSGGAAAGSAAANKSKSISALKAEKASILARYDAWVAAQERMPALVRLLDYLVGCVAVELGVRGTHELLAYLDNPAKTRGVLLVTVTFEPRTHRMSEDGPAANPLAPHVVGFGFSPQMRQVREALVHVMEAIVSMLDEMPRPSTHKPVAAKYIKPAGESFVNVAGVIMHGTPLYVTLRSGVLAHVDNSYTKALDYVRATFEDKRPIFDFSLSWDAAAYDAEAAATAAGPNGHDALPLAFRRDMIQQRRWQRQVDQMKMSNTVGIVFVDSKKMRSSLQESIEHTLDDLKLALVAAGRRAVATCLEQMRAWAKDLEPRPTDLDGYAAMRELYGNLVAAREGAFRAVDAANELFELFRDYGGKPDVKDAVALETLAETALHVRSQLHELGEWVKERSTEMTFDLSTAMQELSSGVMSLLADITSAALGDPEAEVPDMLDALAGLEMRLLDAEEAASRYAQYQTLFGLPVDEPGNLAHVRREFEHRKAAWGTTAEWAEKSTHWMHAPCAGQDAEVIAAAVDEYYRSAYKMAKAARDDRVVAKLKEDIEAFRKYSPLFTDACNPALQAHHWAQILQGLLGRPADDPAPGDPVSVAHLIEWGAMDMAEALSNISGAASKELSLRRALSRMKEDWMGVEFKMVPYKDTGTHVVGHTDEIQMQLDEQLMKIQAMNASPFVKPFRAEAEAWQAALEGLQELLDSWLACQSVWMYLEPIFSSPDIVKQMPAEGAKFAQVDMTFRMLVDEVVANPGAIALAKEVDRRTSLAEANRLLDEVQRGLSRYLEAKRLAFPRFFFLSNDEMLEILSETKDPTRVQPHLRKCFEGIHRLQFEPNTNGVVSAMLSLEGEKVPFMHNINTAAARGKVEQWLLEVEARMFEAVHAVTGRGIEDYAAASAPSGGGKGGAKPKRHEWALRWPGMVVLLAAGVFWTRGVEDALAAQKLPAYEKQCSAELREIVDLVRGELTGLQRATLGALVVMDVHARDVVAALAADKVEAAADFGWQAQLRTYWQATDGKPVAGQPDRDFTARCCMMSASLEYGYEYLGNSSRLVITPLTDRCYRTLMGAIHLNLGGAPEGPAGTGKTETTKDLAKALARQCVVFNCSDTLNYQDMAKFFKGLAAAGAWACFDEFNRINLEVLSVVAQQVLDIQRAIAARLTLFTFEGSELPLKWSAWCAITMNPGYAGRSELPDNLKALFRSVAMMVPDYAMIAEIILYSYGYLAARPAAKKIVACYKLCSEQLSSQDHYDYGMRAVMAVLRAAGNLKRRFANAAPSTANQTPEQQETEELGLVLRSIVDVNLCKFLSHDVPLFNGIVSDLFPGITLPKPDYGPLAAALKTACANSNLQPTEYFITKATQLYEMVLVRHGLMLVGMPFSGKTAAYRTLATALTAVAESNHHHPEAAAADSNPHAKQERASFFVLNPKSVTMGQLYGQNDPASHEWTDGVLAVLFRRCAADPSPDRKWLVLDGPVDAIWIENMNTVLDDNKKLCLNSGEIIAMSAPMNLIFEVGDLAVASPATVSRCGMVYLEPQQLGTGPLLLSWLASLPAHLGTAAAGPGTGGAAGAHAARVSTAGPVLPSLATLSETAIAAAAMGGVKARLGAFFEGLVSPTIRFVRREVKEAAPSLDANLAVSWMRITQALLTSVIGTPELLRKLGGDAKAMPVVDAVAVMALTWSAGCTAASQAGRALVDQFVRRAVAGTLSSLEAPSGHHYSLSDAPNVPLMAISALPPEEGLLYDYYYDLSPLLPSTQAANAAAAANAASNPAAVVAGAVAGAGGAAAPPASQGQWLPWSAMVADAPPIPADASFNSILVPTVDTAAVTFLLSTAINAKYPFLLVGPTGTGKSVTVVRCLLELDPEVFAPANIVGFSAQTSANATQALVDAKVDKRRKGVYGPAGGRRGLVFIDDLNMPQRETYGAQPPIELLRQLLDHGGWYSRDNAFRAIQDVLMVGAMGPPGGGRAAVTPRFSRHFATLCLTEASTPTLKHIFGTIQNWFLTTRAFPDPIMEFRDPIIAATLDVYTAAMTQLLPTPTKSHYTFNLRDCSRVVQGLQAQDAAALQLSASQMLAFKTAAAAAEGGAPAAAPSAGASLRALQEAHVRLWVHEVLRVFYDRLVDVSEQQWLLDLLRDLAYRHFGMRLDGLLSHLMAADTGPGGGGGGGSNPGTESGAAGSITPDVIRRCLFADYMAESDENGYRPYMEIARPSAAVSRLEDLLADYNGLAGPGKRQLHLAMFLYAVEHVTRIARVLRQEGGHALCVGVGGSGRQSLARLAAFICGMEAFQVEISRSYGLNEWRDDLRRLARRAGAEAKPTVFIFGDSQAAQEAFVEDVNSLLNSGEVPNLFPHDERSSICEAVRAAFKRAQPAVADPSPATLWSFFVGRCRANLHVVLAFSPAGDAFRERLRRFPSIVNCCTIDWFHAWPDDALDAVAAQLLAEVDLQGAGQRGAVKDLCKGFHAQVTSMSGAFRREAGRHNYVTPTSYLELISCFATLLAQRRAKVLAQQQKYENGLDKLAFTADQVAVMRAELQALAPVLARTVAETEQLLGEIAREKEEVVEPKRAMVDVEVKQADHAAAAARAIKEECEMILSEALPALEAATQALDTIKSADIKLVQTFKSPPAAVKIVMEAVCVCLDVKPTLVPDPNMAGKKIVDWWDASKRLLMDTTLIQRLKDYDRDNIPQRIIDKVRKEYTGDPDFTPANAAKASSAAEGLCKWVHAMDQYDKVAKVVAPKRAALAEAEAEYANVLMGLHGKQAELKELLEKLAVLEAKLAESQARKAQLEAETELCALKLERAEQLMSGLGGERERWTAEAARLRGSFGAITGDMLLAAGAVAYLGAFTMPYRERALAAWVKQVDAAGVSTSAGAGGHGGGGHGAAFSLTAVLGDPVKIREWVIFGLPNDSFSIDSAVIAATSRRWPLCIDPQGQANRWIKAMHEAQKIKVLKLSDPDYLRTVEAAVSFGLPVLLENVGEELDPSLEPLLLKQTYKQGAQLVIKLGDNVVEYSPDFKLYLTTALRNPHYLPETAVKVALLNFSITPEGLADQLLGVAVAAEMPQLEEQRQALVVSSAENAKQLVEIEARILQVLSSTEGNILEDATAVQVLSEAKRLSDDISAKQAVAEKTQVALDAARTRYRPVAEMSAAVFFAIADLAAVDYMYQYSLSWFIGLFVRSIHASAEAAAAAAGAAAPTAAARANGLEGSALAARLQQIESHFLYAAYCNVSRSLFEKDKLLLSFLLASRLAAHRGHLPHDQLRFLINGGGGAAPAGAAARAPPAPLGIPARAWAELLVLSALPGSSFSSIPAHISRSAEEWAELVESPDPHARPFPAPLDSMLSSFGKLLVLRCLRPDKLVPAVEAWVASELGQAFVSPPPLDLAAAFAEAPGPSTPLLFVLSPGTDPWAALLRFAEERGQAKTLQVISLGQGQGPKAAALIEAARGLGGWVLLQNCHLAPSWMPTLERLWEGIREDNTDAKFRLWMTCMPTPDFPATLLQASVKMTSEPPQGLRANMRRSLALEPLSEAGFWELPPPAAAPSSPPRAGGHRASTTGGGRRHSSLGGAKAAAEEKSAEGAGAEGPPTLKRLLFGLVYLHAAVQERRRYGPIGWNVPYGFDDGDLRISARQMRMYVLDSLQRGNPVPYEALRYAIGECNYGGRVTDDKDRLLLATMLRRIVAPEVAEEARAALLADEDGTEGGGHEGGRVAIREPADTMLEGYMAYVETLPTAAMPDVFGLHLNADISKDLATTNGLLASLTATSGGGGSAGGGAAAGEGDAGAAALVQGLLDRVPADFDLETVQAAYPVSYHQSLNQVLVQELARFNRLLGTLRTSLTQLGRAVAGLALLSAELEGVLQAVEAGQVPAAWKSQSFPSLKPLGGYMADLVERCAFLSGWAERGPPAAFWLGAFFFPPAFTTAALQNFARGHQLPIDAVGFDFEMLRAEPSSLTNTPPSGVYVYGLFLEGAGWDRVGGCLTEPEPKQLYCPAPAIWFKTVRTADSKPTAAYPCPVYRTADRRGVLATTGHSTNFLMTVRLPLDVGPGADPRVVQRRSDHWVLRGVAMLTSLPQ